MRIFFSLVIFLALALSATAAPLKLASWNLEWFPGGRPGASPEEQRSRMADAQQALRALNPDILCLQEIRNWAAAQELISVLPGYSVKVVSNFDGEQQQVIASRLPADSAWAMKWTSSSARALPRGYSFAALRLPDGRYLLSYSLHMKANSGGLDADNIAKRQDAAKQLLAHIQQMEAIYTKVAPVTVALAGDWNTTLDSDSRFRRETTLRSLLGAGFRSTWAGVPFKQRITHPGEKGYPPITFDHVLVKGLGPLTASIAAEPGVSDHYPVLLNVLPSGGMGGSIAAPTPIPIVTAAPTKTSEPEPQVGTFIGNPPAMVGYEEIPGYNPKPSPTPRTH